MRFDQRATWGNRGWSQPIAFASNPRHLVDLLDAAAEGLIVTTRRGLILLCTNAAQRLLRCSSAEAIGRPIDQFISPEVLEMAGDAGAVSMYNEPSAVARIEVIGTDGGKSPAEMTMTRIELDGETVCAISLRDIALRQWVHEELLNSSSADFSPLPSDDTLRLLNASLERQAGRIAQALHDEAGQLLTSAHIALSEIGEDMPPAGRPRIEQVRAHLDMIEAQLRRLAHEIRPRVLDDVGLVAALAFLADGVEQRWRITVTINATLRQRLPRQIETTVYRIMQEAVNNASRHAHASRIGITLEDSTRTIRCVIEDDGTGFEPASHDVTVAERGLGLTGIRDQLDVLGGTLQIASVSGHGTRLTIVIPLER